MGTNTVGSQGGTQRSPGTFANFTLAPGQTGNGNLFAQWQPSSIAGKVYLDSNNNGVQDPGEPNLTGITITLRGVSGGNSVTQTTTTAANGTFLFNNLTPGSYSLTETLPAGLFIGTSRLGTGGGVLNGNTMSNIVVDPNNQLVNYTFAVSPFDPNGPMATKRYFLAVNQSNNAAAAQALVSPAALVAGNAGDPPSFQAAFLVSQNGSSSLLASPDPPTVSPATSPFTNLDLLRALAADASITDPMVNSAGSSNSTSNNGFRLAALTVTGGT
jgi:hypothetical protein